MKKIFMASLLLAALATSCSDDLNIGSNTHTATLTASVTAEQTRAAFEKDGSFYWSSGDEIGVTTTNSKTMFSKMTLANGAGQASATFTGTISGSIGSYAIYPYSKDHGLDGTKLTYSFPATYSLDKVDQTYFPTEKNGNSYNPAMWAYIQDGNVSFKHLGGVFMIKIAKMPCASGTLEFSAKQNLCGKYTADLSSSTTNPQLVNTDASATNTGQKVTITFKGATEGQPGVFYVPVPTGSYDAFLTLSDGNTKKLDDIVAGSFKIARTDLCGLTIGEATIEAGVATTATSVSDASSKLESSNNVALTAEVTGENTVEIPAVASGSTQEAKTLSFSNVAADAKITVKDKNSTAASGESASSVKEFTVTIPNVATTEAQSAPSLDVEMPNSTVTVGGNAGVATINELTASTAENTLIVSSGVTINTLKIKKGNVRINKGATVKAVELVSGGDVQSATVYYEEGASVPTTATNVTFIKIPAGTQIISTEAQFKAALANGGNYALVNDVKATADYKIYSDAKVVIDLNQKTLYMDLYIRSQNGGDLTFKNGNITQVTGSKQDDGGLLVDTNSKLTVDNVVYTGRPDTWDCIFECSNAQNATIVVKNSKIKGGAYAITTNASTSPVANGSITLENSTFEADQVGALLNIPAIVTMKKCSFSGNHQGALLRGGYYTITDCSFTLNAELTADHKENMWLKKWESGDQCAFAALTMGNYINGAYQYVTNATFKGTNKAIVTGTNATSFPAMHVCSANGYAVVINGLNTITLTQTKSTPNNGPEYGTGNITVDGTKIEEANISATTTTNN